MIYILALITLLFVGCDDGILNGQIETYDFDVNTGLEEDSNGYFHFLLSEHNNGTSDQSLKRFTAQTNNPEIQFVQWDCDSYYIYYHMEEEFIVPIINNSSYTDDLGEAHTMFGPHSSMVGDTVIVFVGYVDSFYDIEYTKTINIILE